MEMCTRLFNKSNFYLLEVNAMKSLAFVCPSTRFHSQLVIFKPNRFICIQRRIHPTKLIIDKSKRRKSRKKLQLKTRYKTGNLEWLRYFHSIRVVNFSLFHSLPLFLSTPLFRLRQLYYLFAYFDWFRKIAAFNIFPFMTREKCVFIRMMFLAPSRF